MEHPTILWVESPSLSLVQLEGEYWKLNTQPVSTSGLLGNSTSNKISSSSSSSEHQCKFATFGQSCSFAGVECEQSAHRAFPYLHHHQLHNPHHHHLPTKEALHLPQQDLHLPQDALHHLQDVPFPDPHLISTPFSPLDPPPLPLHTFQCIFVEAQVCWLAFQWLSYPRSYWYDMIMMIKMNGCCTVVLEVDGMGLDISGRGEV